VNITDSRTCNRHNLELLARFLQSDPATVLGIYEELIGDEDLLTEINAEIASVRGSYAFQKGIFRMETIDNVDWFAFERILLYVLTRLRQPAFVLETGVYYGGNAAFILRALQRNGAGTLVSIDLPDSKIADHLRGERHPEVRDSERYTPELAPGFMIPRGLRASWRFIEGDSLEIIPTLTERFDLFIHDSDHALTFMRKELGLALRAMSADGIMVADDIDWSNAFYSFVAEERFYPLLLTDNGKDSLRVRTGVVDLAHPRNGDVAITGLVNAA
jgi:predicted O-methyltransferase YrrM